MHADLSIVVVEDNELLREEMVCFLSRPGWVAHGVDCGEELSNWLMTNKVDVAILDVNLPYEDGYSIAKRLRASHPEIGIVMLTARVRPSDRNDGYQAGADVYLSKPTHTQELIAVIDNLGRRLRKPPTPSYVLDLLNRTLRSPASIICNLTPSELKLLEILAMAPGREVEVEFLIAGLAQREDKDISKEGLATLISRLRSKCKQTIGVDNLVVANRGVGYQLTVPLRIG